MQVGRFDRIETEMQVSQVPRFGPVELSSSTREVRVHGQRVRVTPKEFSMLELLVRKRGACVSKRALMAYLYHGSRQPEIKTIDVHICNLRRKLGSAGGGELVESIWGQGYRLQESAIAEAFAG